MKLCIKKTLSGNESGIIIILTLGLLALISLLAIAYVNLSIIDKKASDNYNSLHQARMLVQSTCQRAIALAASQLSSSSAKASDVYTFNINQDSDGLSDLLETTVEGKTYCSVEDYNASTGPHWQYITENSSSNSKIIGRFAYKVIADQGRIDPSAVSYTYSTEDGSSINGRPGRDVGEIELDAIGSWFDNNESNLTKTGEVRWNSFESIFDQLSITDEDEQTLYKTYFVLDDEADPEAFWSDNGDLQRESSELYHRFNLARNDWADIEVDSLLSQPLPYDSGTSQSDIFSIPWLNNWQGKGSFQSAEVCKKQIAANLIDYNDADTTATTDNPDSPSYVGLEKCPYINELQLTIESQVLTPSLDSGYSIFAAGSMSINGNDIVLTNGHTNGALSVNGESIQANSITYSGASSVSGSNTEVNESYLSSQSIPSMPHSLSWYESNADHVYTDDIKLEASGSNNIKEANSGDIFSENCIIYVKNDKKIEVNENNFNRKVTLVCEGNEIIINGNSINLTPADNADNVLIWADDSSDGKVYINGDDCIGTGIIKSGNELKLNGNGITITSGNLWSDNTISINDNNITATGGGGSSSDYICNVYLKSAQLELIEMYGDSMNDCQAEIKVEGSYNWVLNAQDENDDIDSQVNFSEKIFNISINAAADSYSYSSVDLTDSNISPPTSIVSSLDFENISIDNFKISNLTVKLTDQDSNLLDYSFIEPSDVTTDGITIYDSSLEITNTNEDSEESETQVTVISDNRHDIEGDLKINPGSMSSSHPFIMQTADDGEINVDEIKDWRSNVKYPNSGTASVTEIKIKPKSPGQGGTSIDINGVEVNLDTNTYYTFTGNMEIRLYNSKNSSNKTYGQKTGKWWINIEGENIEIDPDPVSEEGEEVIEVSDESSDEAVDSIGASNNTATVYLNYQVADPRQNLNPDDWIFSKNDSEDSATFSSKNSDWNPGAEDGADKDLESASNQPWEISTAYIRNAPMQSPWELGLIHRGSAFQTINLKQYNTTEGMRGGGDQYTDGDANILDQIKMTSENAVYGKINLNTELIGVIEALYKDLLLGSDVNTPGSGGTLVSDVEEISQYTLDASDTEPFYTRAQILRPLNGVDELYEGYFTQENDAQKEELIGKFINLTKAEAPDEYTIIVVAQVIKDIGDVTINDVVCETGTYDEGADVILATQKILAVVKWDKDSKKFRILRFQYIDD